MNGDGLFTGKDLYFYTNMTLNAYYPYRGSDDTAPRNNGIIEVNTGADNQTPENQPELDFLWDSKTGVDKKDFSAAHPNVNFVFAHKMSKVTFTFLSSEAMIVDGIEIAGPVDVKNMVNYSLKGLVLDGTFDTRTGVCAVDPEALSSDLFIDVTNKVEHNKAVLPLIIIPQTLDGGSAQLIISTDELNDPNNLQHYNCNLAFSDGEIKPGYHYKYTIKVSKLGLIVGKMSIEPWEKEESYMTATIDGENPFQPKKP